MVAATSRPDTEPALKYTILTVLEEMTKRYPRDTKHVQFIAFTNRDCKIANSVASQFFFPKRPERGFVVGERLCFRSNRRHGAVSVANGQIAFIQKIVDTMPGSKKRSKGRSVTTEEFQTPKHQRYVHLSSGEILPWNVFRPTAALGYAITVHRAQGAEAPFIVFLMPQTLDRVTRRLLYTAFTRASKRFILIGNPKSFNEVILRPRQECLGDTRFTH